MPLNNEGKYYLEDVPHGQKASAYMLESVYQEAKTLCENDTRSQEAFEGLIVFLGDCGYTMQKAVLHLLKEGEFEIHACQIPNGATLGERRFMASPVRCGGRLRKKWRRGNHERPVNPETRIA